MEKMIDAREEFIEVENLINKARTFGIPVKNHGHGEKFKNEVEAYNNIIDYYIQNLNSGDEPGEHGNSPTNIKVNLQVEPKGSPVAKRQKSAMKSDS